MMRRNENAFANKTSGIGLWLVIGVVLLLMVLGFIVFSFPRLESQPPTLQLSRDIKFLGRNPDLKLKVNEAGAGLRRVLLKLKIKDQEQTLLDESYPRQGSWWKKSGPLGEREYDLGALLHKLSPLQETAAVLTGEAWDHSYRNWFSGNRGVLEKKFQFKLKPPRLEVISSQHYINQGGCEFVMYRIDPDTLISGVQVGSQFFPGYPAQMPDPNVHFAVLAFAYNLPLDTPMKLLARDAAGNESSASFWFKLFPKKFRSREMKLEDSFLQKVVPEILAQTPDIADQGELIKNFIQINRALRARNHQQVIDLAHKSPGRFLWQEPFVQLSNSKVEAVFADHRRYMYHGQEVDQQDHVGFDLSVTQRVPVEAANDGVVVLARYFGIYGNAVILDHGCGLLSLYGHLSSIDVKEGQTLKKKEVLGHSGASGLAGGDHLHFGLFLQGVPVNPTEWWDPHWIQVHLRDRIK
jgi:murein DD-endopeptidase MepM/ murein hydrolase activator NlpD